MSLPEGTPGSRTDYTVDITAREKEACERYSKMLTGPGPIPEYVEGDSSLVIGVLRKIASALERLAELERILDGRPGPGNRRPPREDAPSSKVQPAPRPAFTHAGPAPGATTSPSSPTSPPTPEPPSLTERPDF